MNFKRFTFFAFLCVFGFSQKSYSQTTDSLLLSKINGIVKKVQLQFAPDKRTAIFESTWKGPKELLIESTNVQALSNFEKEFRSLGQSITLIKKLLPDTTLSGKYYGVATLSVCNNKVKPGHSTEMATQMTLGTPVEVLQKAGGWYQVRTPDGYISWTEDNGIALMDKPSFERWQQSSKIIFTKDFGHALKLADQKSERVSDLINGNILEVLATEGLFYKVRFPDGRPAFVYKQDAEDFNQWQKERKPDANHVISAAKQMMGTPYLWGGTSIKGVDCSGFTKTSFFLNGVIIPRDASQQVLVGEPVDIYENQEKVSIEKCLKNLLPGDLLFFSGERNKGLKGRVTHVAIYLGNGQFIHSAGLVRINSMLSDRPDYADYQTRTLVSARRLINQIGTKQITLINKNPFYQLNPNGK